jgi:hypothetical protein
MHGYGVYTYPSGIVYEGQFIQDRKEGFGVYLWTDGRRYEGFW